MLGIDMEFEPKNAVNPMGEVLEEIRRLGHIRHVSICYKPENEGARFLYRPAGIEEAGLDEEGEMVADLVLSADEQ